MSDKVVISSACGALPETVRGRPYILHCDPKGEKLVYGNCNNVIIRDLKDPHRATVVNHHSLKVSAVAYSPSGFYIASGDAGGNIKIWDTVGEEHIVKYEYRPISGEVRDISWSEDSKRIVIAGDGRENYVVAIMCDTGATVGSTVGHTKCAMSCDFRKKRPYSVVTCSEDFTIAFFKNIPLKYEKAIKTHTNFVNCVRFSNNCDLVASCSSDGKIFIYEADTMNVKLELKDDSGKAHKGGVYGVSFSPCDKFLVSSSGDKTIKIWNVKDGSCVKSLSFGDTVMDQQLGCLWMKDKIVTISLSGKLNIIEHEPELKVVNSIWGHNKAMVACVVSEDKSTFFTSSYEGILNAWDIKTCESSLVEGAGLKNQISAMSIFRDKVAVCGVDDIVMFFSASKKRYDETPGIKVPSQPHTVCLRDERTVAVGCDNHIIVIVDGKIVVEKASEFIVTFVCFSKNDPDLLLVCGKKDLVVLYRLSGDSLVKNDVESFPISDIGIWISYSPDNSMLAVATSSKSVICFKSQDFKKIVSWSPHGNKVTCVAWSPDGKRIASCGVDGNMYIMKPEDRFFLTTQRNIHRGQFVRAINWLDDQSFITMGQQDCLVKFWTTQ